MKRATIYDVSKLAGVSPATVSRALRNQATISETTKQRVREACEQLDYVPDIVAQGLSGQKTYTIGIVIPDISDPYFSALCSAIERHCADYGYRVLLSNTLHQSQSEVRAVEQMISQQVDGLLISAHSMETQEQHRQLIGNLPCVYLGNNHTDDCSYVEVDNERGAYEAAQYLYMLGHRRIAFLGGRRDSRTLELRLEGYRRAMQSHGLEQIELVAPKEVMTMRSWCYDRAMECFQGGRVFDAVIAYTDVIAMRVLDAAERCGLRVPDDISLIGFDDSFGRLNNIRLSTVSQQKGRTGQLAVERLIDQINGNMEKTADILDPELMIRDTCRRIKIK